MPKERIYADCDRAGASTGSVGLGWGRGESPVLLATCAHMPDGNPGEEIMSGVTIMLDRERINSLIRALRKARDQAFGVDA